MANRRLTRPTSSEEKMIVDIAAVGEGIAPIYNYDAWVSDPKKIPRVSKRKFRKLWRAAEKWMGTNGDCPNWYRTFAKSQLVASYLMKKNKKNA